jgi:hypothetical protein
VDQPDGKAVEDVSFGGFHHLNFWDLARFDLVPSPNSPPPRQTPSNHSPPWVPSSTTQQKKNFWITNQDSKECHAKELTGKMPAVWDWLEKADFAHNRTEGGETFDVWRYHTGGVTLELAVPAKEPNRPVEFSRRSAHDHYRLYVQEFRPEKPNSSLFDVPKECEGRSTFEPVHIN